MTEGTRLLWHRWHDFVLAVLDHLNGPVFEFGGVLEDGTLALGDIEHATVWLLIRSQTQSYHLPRRITILQNARGNWLFFH